MAWMFLREPLRVLACRLWPMKLTARTTGLPRKNRARAVEVHADRAEHAERSGVSHSPAM